MSSTGSNPPQSGSNVKDPHQQTDGTVPPIKRGVDIGIDVKAGSDPKSSNTDDKQ